MKHLTIQTLVLNLSGGASSAANKSYFDKLKSLRLCLVAWLVACCHPANYNAHQRFHPLLPTGRETPANNETMTKIIWHNMTMIMIWAVESKMLFILGHCPNWPEDTI